jgi:conjugal transfer mating pair stabilization protein TraG
MQWEIFTTGGGYYLYDTFNMLAAYTSSGNFRNLLSIGVIFGVAWAGINMAMGGSIGSSLKYVLTMIVVMGLTLGPKSTVVIVDKTSGALPIYGLVDNVPTPVAMVGHYTSAISYYLTGQMETLMSTPTDLTYQKNGIMFGASLLSQASTWRAVTPKIHENLVNFMQNCVIDATNLGHMDLEMVATSGGLENFIGTNMPSSMAFYDVVAGETRVCKEAWSDVRAAVAADVDVIFAQKAASLFQGGTGAGAANINRLKGTLGDFQNMMAMSSASAVNTVKQAMYVNALDDGMMRFIANSGNSAAMDIYQVARADIQTRSSYSAIGANAAKWVPLLKIVFETLYYAAFPLAALMMMTPLAPAVLKGYMGGFVWLAAWEPLSAILHSIVIKASTGFYRSAGAVTTDGSVNDVVLSWANHFGIRAVEQDVGTVAGFLMMSVPFLATAIMFGANRMTGMATSMLNVSQGAAIETGREAATGSIGLGNMSMNNYAGNKMNMSSVVDVGRETMTFDTGGIATRNMDGSFGYAPGSAVSSGGISSQASAAVRSELSSRAESSKVAASSAANELGSYISQGASELTSFGESVSSGKAGSKGYGWDMTSSEKTAVSQSYSRVQDFAAQHGITTDQAMRLGIAGNVGVSAKAFGNGASGGLDGNMNIAGGENRNWTEIAKAAESSNLASDVAKISTSRASASGSTNDGTQTTAGEERRFNLDEGERLAQTYISRMEEADSYARAQSYVESAGSSLDTNLNQMVAGELHARGESPLAVSQILNPKTDAEVAESRAVVGSIVSKITDQVVADAPSDPTSGYSVDMDPAAFRKEPAREATFGGGDAPPRTVNIDQMRDNATETISGYESDAQSDTTARTGYQNEQTAEVGKDYGNTVTSVRAGTAQNVPQAMWGRVERMLNINSDERSALQAANPEAWNTPGAALDFYGSNPDKFEKVTGRPFVDGDELGSSPENRNAAIYPTPMRKKEFSPEERDVMIRTVLGEASGEGMEGQAAVAMVIRNRSEDARFPDSVGAVSLQRNQFSAWNTDGSGNHLVSKYNPGDPAYEQAAYVVDAVMGGYVPDFTEGATHYYSPAGMQALVDQGYQKNLIPGWLQGENAARDSLPVSVGGHVFTGQMQGRG